MVYTFKFSGRLIVVSVSCLILALTVMWFAFPWLRNWYPANSSELASWAQAIGAIFAIVAAGNHITRQINHAESQARETKQAEDRIAMLACIHAANDATMALENLAGKIAGIDDLHPRTSLERMVGLEHTFQIILAKQIPPEAVVPILNILREISYSLSAIRAGRADPNGHRDKNAYKRADVVRKAAEDLVLAMHLKYS